VCAGKIPINFLQSPRTIKIVNNLSEKLRLPRDQITIGFNTGPYRGTWVHRDLALRLAEYCDDTCQLETAVGQAIRALADRPPAAAAPAFPAPPPVESFPVYQQLNAEAQGMALIVAVEEKGMALRKEKLAMHPDLLAAKKRDYRAKEKHIAEMGSIKATNEERTAAVKRKAQAAEETEKLERFKKAVATQAAITAKKDNQDRLRSWGSSIHLPLGNTPRRGVNGLMPSGSHGTSNTAPARTTCAERAAAGTFILVDAAEKAAVQLGVPAFEVKRFMGSRQGEYTMYQTVIGAKNLEKKGSTITHSARFGWNDTGMYCASKFNAAVTWIKNNYKSA